MYLFIYWRWNNWKLFKAGIEREEALPYNYNMVGGDLWSLSQKNMCTKLDIYICITFTESIPLLLWAIIPQKVSSCPVVIVSALSQRYTYYWILLFLNNIIIIKTNVT